MRIGQVWLDAEGGLWRVVQIHYKDRLVELLSPTPPRVRWFVSFDELGRHYHLTEEQPRGP